MIGFLCLAAGILVGFSTEQPDTSGGQHGLGVPPRQKRENANDRSALHSSNGKSRFLPIIDHFLSEALQSKEAEKEEIHEKLLLARHQLLEIPRQTTDEQKLHVTMKVLASLLMSSDSFEAAVHNSDSDFVRNLNSAIYWMCESILTYRLEKKDEVRKIVDGMSVNEETLNETIRSADQLLSELAGSFRPL
ncbi:hypothetical protein Q1695_004515 [Nippostrongylus brasiliensis]|nr:hypothetical protein Q1695_004515 [Nippostrongylus brasiliensis]